jgi:uncharacterized protein YqgC (DUF456 family)
METLGQDLALLLVLIAFVLGLIGTFLPLVPGSLLVWVGVVFYAWPVDGFDTFHPFVFALITLVGIVAGTADIWLPLLGAKTGGANWRALAAGVLGGLLGTFVIPLPVFGTIIGYGAGILLAEYGRLREWRPALRATFGGVVGWGASAAVELVGAVIMILLFFTQV